MYVYCILMKSAFLINHFTICNLTCLYQTLRSCGEPFSLDASSCDSIVHAWWAPHGCTCRTGTHRTRGWPRCGGPRCSSASRCTSRACRPAPRAELRRARSRNCPTRPGSRQTLNQINKLKFTLKH